jgi:hypothetical protein
LKAGAALCVEQLGAILEGIGDEREVEERRVGRQLASALGFLPAAQPALVARLHSGTETARENVAFARARSGFDLAVLLDDDDAAVTAAAAAFVQDEAGRPDRAAELLKLAGRMSMRTRVWVAQTIALLLVPRKPPTEVLLLVMELHSEKVTERREVGKIGGLASEHVDCLWSAPILAVALVDEGARVREAAASSLYYLFDEMPHELVRITQPALESALARETDAGAERAMRIAPESAAAAECRARGLSSRAPHTPARG